MTNFAKLPSHLKLAPGSMPLFAGEPAFPPRAAEVQRVTVKDPGRASSGLARLRALGRLPVGAMNKTETAYAEHLDARKAAGEILWWKFEGVKLRLADNCFLTVDFSLMRADGQLEMHDVKGGAAVIQDDSKVKIKVAAAEYPFAFFIAIPRRKRDGGGWDVEEVGA